MPHDGHDFTEPPPDPALRVKALESLLVEKGLVDPAALDLLIDTYEHKIGPRNGARVVARAWVDDAFKQAIKQDCTAAIKEAFGFEGRQGEHIVAIENTPARCARATRGACSACRRSGTSRRPTARAWCRTRAAC
jgi:nitrile hydratase